MINTLISCFIFSIIYLFASAQGLAFWWGHLVLAIFCLVNLHRISKFYIFWIYLLIIVLSSSDQRFSLEYFFITTGLLGFSLSPWWQNKETDDRRNLLILFFAILYIIDLKRLALYERGSLLLWFPIFLAIYYNQKNLSSYLSRAIAGLALVFSNKKTVLLGYLATLVKFFKIQYLILTSIMLVGLSFLLVEKISRFLEISIYPRLFIWNSCIQGWLAKPIFGHGFGTFAINFPPFRAHSDVHGALLHQQISHGHNLLTHFLFEQGLIGLISCILIFYLVYKHARDAFLPLMVIALFDAPLFSFNQYFLASLILFPYIKFELLHKSIQGPLLKFSRALVYIVAIVLFTTSIIGHYYYDKQNYDQAIKWDPYHSLYHFTRGAVTLNTNIKQSLVDLKRAVELNPNVAFYYGFLAGAELGNNQNDAANNAIDRAIELDGEETYWSIIKAFANYSDHKVFDHYFSKAIKAKPELVEIIQRANISSDAAITGQGGDARVPAFYRRGPDIPLPLPYFESGFPERIVKLIESLKD